MNHGSLFSGIGGFDLASQWCGWDNVFQVEYNEFCQKVLSKNFPQTKRYKDIYDFKGEKTRSYRGTIDIISGGFPCQPFSVAGKQKGKEDDRYLWPEMFRVIQEIKPNWVVGENVAGIIGVELDKTVSDLEDIGYEVQVLIVPACAVNAPHRRDRVWIIAYTNGKRFNSMGKNEEVRLSNEYSKSFREKRDNEDNIPINAREFINNAKCGILRDDDGIPKGMDRIKALGNAIVPQVAYEIFRCIDILK